MRGKRGAEEEREREIERRRRRRRKGERVGGTLDIGGKDGEGTRLHSYTQGIIQLFSFKMVLD